MGENHEERIKKEKNINQSDNIDSITNLPNTDNEEDNNKKKETPSNNQSQIENGTDIDGQPTTISDLDTADQLIMQEKTDLSQIDLTNLTTE